MSDLTGKKRKKGKKQRGITLIALVVTIIVLIILAGVSINMLVGENGIINMAQRAKENMKIAQKEEEEQIAELSNQLDKGIEQESKKGNKPNVPELASGMTAIKFIDPTDSEKGTVIETTSNDADWYNYDKKKWANAQTDDGSMWVWIPRFAYRVNSSTQTFDVVFLIGTSDQYYDENGEPQTAKRCTSEDEVVDTTTGYTVHPAFTDERSINFRNGGWDKELRGIWVAKFEAGYASGNNDVEVVTSNVNYTRDKAWVASIELHGDAMTGEGSGNARNWLDGEYGSSTTAIKYPVFQPVTYSMNYITHNDAYNIAKALNANGNPYGFNGAADSHLMKNSEWGAVAYLSKSQYGLGSTDITVNNISLENSTKSVYAVTGCTSNSTSETTRGVSIETINATTGNIASGGVYTWNQLTGTTASCTGTIYGIYDLSGGAWERTTGYVANGKSQLKDYGVAIAYEGDTLKTISTKYTTVYPHNSTTDSTSVTDTTENLNTASSNNWLANTLIYGDAIRETSTAGTGKTSWYEDTSGFHGLQFPFSYRGGTFFNGSDTGLFFFYRGTGDSHYGSGFRAVVVVS